MAEGGAGGARRHGAVRSAQPRGGAPSEQRSRQTPLASARVSPARRAAYDILLAVGAGQGHSDELLHAAGPGAATEGLSELDRNLATALVLGVLRWQLALDRQIRALLTRPDAAVAEDVMIALRVGAFQLLHMDRVPAHAALSESVALARRAGEEHATGMVNAVLRRLGRERPEEKERIFETPAAMARRLAHPEWLVARWVQAYGYAVARAICEADQREPPEAVWFAGEPAAGAWGMDDGSRLVAELAAAAAPAGIVSLRVWDCCAAPGGKTRVLAERLPQAEEILATDSSQRRLRGMETRLGALAASAGEGGRVRCLKQDATALPALEGSFDLVLCDAPCSGTGTLARNPEIRLRLDEEALARQAARQRALLTAAMERTRPGGRVVYSTCSLEREEGEGVVDAVLGATGAGWRRAELAPLLGRVQAGSAVPETVLRDGALRTLPGVDPADGFYALVLERVAE